MKIKFIINPIAGGKNNQDIEKIIDQYLDLKRFKHDLCYTNYPLHAKEISKKAVEDGYDAIIGVGGDGTVNEISSELIHSKTVLGIIPSGSGNGFAFHIGMKKDIKDSILQVNTSKIHTIDSCVANNHPFINVSGIGFDAYIAKLFSTSKERGFLNYIKLIIKNLQYQAKDYTIKYNNQKRDINAILISFANASQYGNNFRISPDSKIDDGLIDFVIIKDMARWKVPMFLLKIARGEIKKSPFVEIIQAKSMEIRSNEEIIHLDGETKGIKKDVIINIHPKSLKVLMPNE